jgi:phi13 family phage major tail protein
MTDYTLIKGVDKLYYALVTQDDVNAYAAATPVALAPLKLAVQTPKTNSKTEYYDNKPMFPMNAEGETPIKLDIAMLPLDVQAEILGKVYDATNESLYDNGGTAPYCALGYRAKNSDGTYTYYWFYKGIFKPFEEQANSETDTPDPKGITLEFTAVHTIYPFALTGSINDSTKRRVSRKQADGATWFDSVKVPVVGVPAALTCTPVPADAATGVAVNSNITLTFSNALAGNAENGIVLTTAAGVPKACARTLNAARTVVTLNPTTDLAAATDYLISVPGVRDVYGQTLADTVFDFETA